MYRKISLFVLRVSMGWVFLYVGLTKILNPEWSAAGYMKGAKTFTSFYNWFLQPDILPAINFINEWGLALLGASLILGIFVRWSCPLGALLMLLYYFPILDFPKAGMHGFLIDEHIIYALILVFLAAIKAGETWGLDKFLRKVK